MHYHALRMRESAPVSPFFPTPSNPPARATHPTRSRATHRHRDTKPTTPAFNSKLGHSLLSFSRIPFQLLVRVALTLISALIDSNQCGDLCSSLCFCESSNWVVVISVANDAEFAWNAWNSSSLSFLSLVRYSAKECGREEIK